MDNQGIPAEVVSSNRILYTASALAKSSLLHLQEIGALKALQPHTSARSGLQSLLFFYVVEGSGELTYQGQRTALGPGSCVWVDCSRPYAHATGAGDLWSIRWIHFFGPMASAIYRKYRELRVLKSTLSTLRPAVVALIASAGVTMLLQLLFGGRERIAVENLNIPGLVLFAAAFFALRKWKPGPIPVMLLCGLGGLLIVVGIIGLLLIEAAKIIWPADEKEEEVLEHDDTDH